jgi:serine/threonine-protein kinase
MSPEQMRSTRAVDTRTDIWSLGVIFYELVTGRLPFIADSVPELSAKVLLEEPVPLSAECPHLPLELELIVNRALSKKVDERYPSIAEFVVELLPYAPVRARQNVERISKLLRAAGLSTTDFHASRPPPPNADGSGSYDVARLLGDRQSAYGASSTGERSITGNRTGDHANRLSVGSGSFPSETEVNFGSTKGPSRGVKRGIVAVVTLLVVGGTIFVATLFTRGTSDATVPKSAGQPVADVALPPTQPEPKVQASKATPDSPTPSASEAAQEPEPEKTEQKAAKVAAPKTRVQRPPAKRRASVPAPEKKQDTKGSSFDFGGRE